MTKSLWTIRKDSRRSMGQSAREDAYRSVLFRRLRIRANIELCTLDFVCIPKLKWFVSVWPVFKQIIGGMAYIALDAPDCT